MNINRFLLINPPIYDFAAYDLWVKPLGLLYIAAIVKSIGAEIDLIDYLDRNHYSIESVSNKWGCGHYFTEEVQKPDIFNDIPRRYKRYGVQERIITEQMQSLDVPDAVLVTSTMTYWYPGVQEAIKTVKRIFPKVPVFLGGIYASICPDHAKNESGADYVIKGDDIKQLAEIFHKIGINIDQDILPDEFQEYPGPCYDFYSMNEYAAIRTTRGCPFNCTYCASEQLNNNGVKRKSVDKVINEIKDLYGKGIKNFAFYDDALLFDAKNHIIPVLKEIKTRNIKVNLHSPNGLHARYIDSELAKLMKDVNFVMPRLSLETSNTQKQKETGGKVNNEEFMAAVKYLKKAGYRNGEYGAYILIGMLEQSISEIEQSIIFAHEQGAKVYPAEYSPIPNTKDWGKIKQFLPSEDPLWHNNSLFPLHSRSMWPKFQAAKRLAHGLNNRYL